MESSSCHGRTRNLSRPIPAKSKALFKSEALKHVCKAVASSPGGLHVQASTALWSHKGLSDWDISLTLQARFWSLHTRAFLAKWHAGKSEVCSLCGLTSDTVPHRLGGCTHPAIPTRVNLRHGCTVDLIAHMVGMGRHGDCFMLHDAEGHDGRYRRFPDWLLGMDRLLSRPDLVPLEQGPGGRAHGIDKDAWLHLVVVTFTTDFALVDRVASKTAQHERLSRCLAEAGWSSFTSSLLAIQASWVWTMPKLCWTWGYPFHKCSQPW